MCKQEGEALLAADGSDQSCAQSFRGKAEGPLRLQEMQPNYTIMFSHHSHHAEEPDCEFALGATGRNFVRGSDISGRPDPGAQMPSWITHYSGQPGSHQPVEPRSPFTRATPRDLLEAFIAVAGLRLFRGVLRE